MPRDMPTLVVPTEASIPSGDIAAVEWIPVKATAEQVATQRYDVRKYGAIETANDGPTFQAAITSISNNGGGILTGPAALYTFTSAFEYKDNVYLDFPESAVFDFSGVTAGTAINGCCAYGEGSVTALPALASAIAMRGRTILFASAPAVVPGDRIFIYDSADFSFNNQPGRAYYRRGEAARVIAVSGNTVTLSAPTFDTYASGSTVSVYRMNPIRCGLTGPKRIYPADLTGEKVVFGADLKFNGVMRGSERSHLTISRCVDVDLDGLDIFHWAGSLYGYGVTIANCQNVDFGTIRAETYRHGVTLGGDDSLCCIPVRKVKGIGGRISGLSPSVGNQGLNMHGNVEYIEFLDIDMPAGVTIAGDHTKVRGTATTAPHGVAVQGAELLGWSHDIDLKVDVNANHPQDRAVIYLPGTRSTIRTGGKLKLRGSIDTHAFGAVSGVAQAIYILNNGGSPLNDIDADVDISSDNQTYGTIAYGLRITALSVDVGLGTEVLSGFRDIRVSSRLQRMGMYINCSPRESVLTGCKVYQPPVHGIWWAAMTNPFFTNPIIRSSRNNVQLAGTAGLYYAMPAGAASSLVDSNDDTATNCNQGLTGTSTTGVSIFIQNAATAIYRYALVGDGTGKQTNRDAMHGIGTLIEEGIVEIGTVTGRSRGTITTHRFQGRGAGAPTFACADGSTYLRTDGAAATTLYVRAGGAWVAK